MSERHPALRSAFIRWQEILAVSALDHSNPWRLACLRALPEDYFHRSPLCDEYIIPLLREAFESILSGETAPTRYVLAVLEDPHITQVIEDEDASASEESSTLCHLIPHLGRLPTVEAFAIANHLAFHPSAPVRLALATALGCNGPFSKGKLGNLDPDQAIHILERLAKDEDPDVAWMALAYLDGYGAFPEDAQTPPPPTTGIARALAENGLPHRRGLWRAGLEGPLLEALSEELRPCKGNINGLRSSSILPLADWLRLGGKEVDAVFLPWLTSTDPMQRMAAALMLGIHCEDPDAMEQAPDELRLLARAVSPLPGGEAALRELLGRADAVTGHAAEDDHDIAILALIWRAIWDPLARLALERLHAPDVEMAENGFRKGKVSGMGFDLFVEGSCHDGLPHYGLHNRKLSLLSALDPPHLKAPPEGVPRHLAIKVQALLAMAEDTEPARMAWALGRLLFSADGPWLDAPMASALNSNHPYCQNVALLYLKCRKRFEELALAVDKAPAFALDDLTSLVWAGVEELPGWQTVCEKLFLHPHPKVRSGVLFSVNQSKTSVNVESLQNVSPFNIGYFLLVHPMAGSLPLLQTTLAKLKKDNEEDMESRLRLLKALACCPDEGTRETMAEELPQLPWDLTDVSVETIMDALDATHTHRIFLPKVIQPGKILGLLPGQEPLNRLVAWANSPNLTQRSEAVKGLALHPAPECLKHLMALTKDPHPGLARKAIRALGCRPEPEIIDHLKALMDGIDPAQRKAATLGLLLSSPEAGARLLLMTLKRLKVPTDQMPFKGLADFGRALLRLAENRFTTSRF